MVSLLLRPSKYHQIGLLKLQVEKPTIQQQQPLRHSGVFFPSKASCQPHSGELAAAREGDLGNVFQGTAQTSSSYVLPQSSSLHAPNLHLYLYNHLKTQLGAGGWGGGGFLLL